METGHLDEMSFSGQQDQSPGAPRGMGICALGRLRGPGGSPRL